MERAFLFANRLVCGVLLAAACALVFANVVMRYGFGQSLARAEEVSRYLAVPVGCVLMLVHLALMAPAFVRRVRSDEDKVAAAELGGGAVNRHSRRRTREAA